MKNIKRVKLHPATIRQIKKGHPWVTLDKFSAQFPKKDFFLIGKDENTEDFCILLNDPLHPKIKARVWEKEKQLFREALEFSSVLDQRISIAIEKRAHSEYIAERENYYLVFGEADQLPGLLIQMLGTNLVIQIYSSIWKDKLSKLNEILASYLTKLLHKDKIQVWFQERGDPNQKGLQFLGNLENGMFRKVKDHKDEEFVIQEFGVNYKLSFQDGYDLGIYTDMAAIRKSLTNFFSAKTRLLNLYSYTGAFSLFALQNGVNEVTSVDLSAKYMSCLEFNIKLNPSLHEKKHHSIVKPTKKVLLQFREQQAKFDFIICDPPSSSSDKKKTSSALKEYEILLPLMTDITEKDGFILVFLNTHKISMSKFRDQILGIIKSLKNSRLSEIRTFGLGEDCPRLKGFPEGNYLKGILLKKK